MFASVNLLITFLLSIEAASNGDTVMWNILGRKSLRLLPEDAACVPDKTYCSPSQSAIRSAQNSRLCDAVVCTPNSIVLSSLTDGNLGSSFITRSLNRLEILAQLNATYDVSLFRHILSSGFLDIKLWTEPRTVWKILTSQRFFDRVLNNIIDPFDVISL